MANENQERAIYIAGPMRGKESGNFKAFRDAEIWLEGKGWNVINPQRISTAFGGDYFIQGHPARLDAVMKAERDFVKYCDAIYLLKGWECSEGAKGELAEAIRNGLEIIVGDEGGEG